MHEWKKARTLAKSVLARQAHQPIPLSQREVELLARCVEDMFRSHGMVDSDDPIDGPQQEAPRTLVAPYHCTMCTHHVTDHADMTIIHGERVRPCKMAGCLCMDLTEEEEVPYIPVPLKVREPKSEVKAVMDVALQNHGAHWNYRHAKTPPTHLPYLVNLLPVLMDDADSILETDPVYGGSWQLRGGVGAFMMLARKWDRLEQRVRGTGWDVFRAITEDTRREGVIDDVRDLRRYLALVEAKAVTDGLVTPPTTTFLTEER
jgi:hypothetical protein